MRNGFLLGVVGLLMAGGSALAIEPAPAWQQEAPAILQIEQSSAVNLTAGESSDPLPASEGLDPAPMPMDTETAMAAPAPGATPPAPAAPGTPPPPAAEQFYTLDEIKGEMKKLAWTKGDYTITPYGILWGSMAYESQRTYTGDVPFYVLPERTNTRDQFHVDARSTRLGIDVLGPRIPLLNCAQSGGKVEFDFQRMIDVENKASVLLRHAYVEVKDEEFRLLMGQTWDVVSPLNPGTLAYSPAWGAGNLGYRRAQLRGERYLAFSDYSMLTLQGSLNTDILQESGSTALNYTGDQAGWPVIEGRLAWTLGERGPGLFPWEFGVSSHIGEQIYDFRAPTYTAVTGAARRTWSFNTDFKLPMNECWGVQGEFFTGENLGPYMGGALQGIDVGTTTVPGTTNTIRTTGGWLGGWYNWTSRLHSHMGYCIDDPIDTDVTIGRIYNSMWFANLSYDLSEKFLVGVEFSSWKTLWAGSNDGDSQRVEFVAKYGF